MHPNTKKNLIHTKQVVTPKNNQRTDNNNEPKRAKHEEKKIDMQHTMLRDYIIFEFISSFLSL